MEEVVREGFREEAVARERKVKGAHPRAQGSACLYKVVWGGGGGGVSSGAAESWAVCVWGGGEMGSESQSHSGQEMVGGRRERGGSEVGAEGVGKVRGG